MASLLDVYQELFPDAPNRKNPFDKPPYLPTDIFAYAAHLIERSGAYYHISPKVERRPADGYRRLLVDGGTREWAKRTGRAWRESPPAPRLPLPPSDVAALWKQLDAYRKEEVFNPLDDRAKTPKWWDICLRLVMVSDEACAGVGFDPENAFVKYAAGGAYVAEDLSNGEVFRRIQAGPLSLSTAADDILCVQAKSRTPSVGCTLRSLTHHLSLLPSRGVVRARWVEPPFYGTPEDSGRDLGLLLVPFPYRVVDESFHSAGASASGKWGWFRASQKWLPRDKDRARRAALVKFICHLVNQARKKGERVDGVVLPELALNYSQFLSVARALARDGGIDFLISGISKNEKGRHGNFVAIAPFFLLGNERSSEISHWERLILVREKHHRWKMGGTQVTDYGLGKLDPEMNWWEDLTILGRSLDVLVYRT